jgi:phage gp36-like protein
MPNATLYANPAQMLERFGEHELMLLTDRDGSAGTVVDAVLNTALADASGLIDGYLVGRYALPMDNPPVVLTRLCCDIARYSLYDDQGNEQVSERNKDALRFLEKVSQGQINLGLSNAGEVTPSLDLPVMQSQGSVFARDKSKGFI